MAAKSTVWKDPLLETFIRSKAPILGWASHALYDAAQKEFGFTQSLSKFKQFALSVKNGHHITIPDAEVPQVDEMEMRLPWKTALITGDYQIPYHDEELVKKAFSLGVAWEVEGHAFNADVFDMAAISKFSPQIYGERVPLGEELQIGKDIIQESRRLHGQVALLTGNHEWRLLNRLLGAALSPTQVRDLLAGEGVLYTPLSYAWLGYDEENAVRISHPRVASVIAGAVGVDIARNHDCHVIVAHDHLLAQRRSHSGRWTVVHSGMMAKPGRLMYAVTADDRRPRMNQGFVIVHPDSKTGQPRLRLIDPKNCDWDLEFFTAGREKVG